jgi:hypothetical protein
MDKREFIESHPALIDQLLRSSHHPEEKVRILHDHIHDGWEDRMFIWALEHSGEEDVLIEVIAQHLGWSEDRVMDALEAAGWSHARSLGVFYRTMTNFG